MVHHYELKNRHIFTSALSKLNEMSKINKLPKNVNKWEIFKKLFSTWKFNPKATSYATFEIFGWYLMQKMNFTRIHVIFYPKWFPRPVAIQEQFFQPLLWPMVIDYWEINYRELRFSDYQFIPLIDGPSVNSIGSVPCTLITKLSIL